MGLLSSTHLDRWQKELRSHQSGREFEKSSQLNVLSRYSVITSAHSPVYLSYPQTFSCWTIFECVLWWLVSDGTAKFFWCIGLSQLLKNTAIYCWNFEWMVYLIFWLVARLSAEWQTWPPSLCKHWQSREPSKVKSRIYLVSNPLEMNLNVGAKQHVSWNLKKINKFLNLTLHLGISSQRWHAEKCKH